MEVSVLLENPNIFCKSDIFMLKRCSHPQNTATPNFFADSKSFTLGLSKGESNNYNKIPYSRQSRPQTLFKNYFSSL